VDVPDKRTHVYLQRPREYEISGCECGNDDPDWSEWQHMLWCAKCQKDFIPAQSGIFDGPILVQAARLMGIDLRLLNIATGEIEDPVGQFTK
jgi:hypothetical protein